MTGKAWGAGDLGMDHAQVIANTIREQDYDLALDMEGFLAEHAAGLTVEQLKTVAAELLAAAAPETSDDEAAKKRAAQRLNLSETLDGMWRLDGWLDPEAGLIVSNGDRVRSPANPIPTVMCSPNPRRTAAPKRWCSWPVMRVAHAEDCNGQGGNRTTIIVGMSHQSLLDGLGHGRNPGRQTSARRSSAADGVRCRDHPGRLRLRLPDPRLRPAAPAPSPPGYAASSSPATAAASSPAAIGHPPGPRSITASTGSETTAKPNPKTSKLLCLHHHHKCHEGGWEITIGNDKDRTPWFHPPDGTTTPQRPTPTTLPTRHRHTPTHVKRRELAFSTIASVEPWGAALYGDPVRSVRLGLEPLASIGLCCRTSTLRPTRRTCRPYCPAASTGPLEWHPSVEHSDLHGRS